jgi:hypothetical protein
MEIRIDTSILAKRGLFLATPMYGGMCAGMFAKSCADLAAICAQNQIPLQFYFLFNESLITRARNYCCDEFMRGPMQHMMFIDADIGFNPQDVIALMALQAEDEEKYEIIGGPYPKKCISWEKIRMAVDKGVADEDPNILERFVGDYVFNPKGVTSFRIDEPVEVLEIGTGFMMVAKQAMQKFEKAHNQYMYRPDHVRTEHFDGSRKIMQYFQAEIDGPNAYKEFTKALEAIAKGSPNAADVAKKAIEDFALLQDKATLRYLSEDYWFCQKAQEIGLKTWFCPWMQLQHVGTYIFGGSLADLASIGANPTADPSKLGGKKKK